MLIAGPGDDRGPRLAPSLKLRPKANPNQLSPHRQARSTPLWEPLPPGRQSGARSTSHGPRQGRSLAVQPPRLFSVSAPRAAPAVPLALSLLSRVPGALETSRQPLYPPRREKGGTRQPCPGSPRNRKKHARRNAEALHTPISSQSRNLPRPPVSTLFSRSSVSPSPPWVI